MIEAADALTAGRYFEAESLLLTEMSSSRTSGSFEVSGDREGQVLHMLASIYMMQRCPHQAERIYDMMQARGDLSRSPLNVLNRAHLLASTYRCKEAIASLQELLASESLAPWPDLQEVVLRDLGCHYIDDGQFK